jgi:iron complex transport system permease protein
LLAPADKGDAVRRFSGSHALILIGICAAAWAIIAGACLFVGSTRFGFPADKFQFALRRDIVLTASLVGAALGAAGVAYQAILRNPLADPYLLGVSSGSSLFAYIWNFRALTPLLVMHGVFAEAISQQAFAFVGGIIAVTIVLMLASSRGRLEPITLLLVGVIVNAVNASIFLLINALQKQLPASGGPMTFLVGGIQTVTVEQLVAAAVCVAIGWLILFWFSGDLNAAILSEAEAQSLGVRIHLLRWSALIVASLVTASAVAISGPIGFVGLVCPHVARLIVGHDTRRLLPVSTAMGAALLAIADAASRMLARQEFAQTVLPVGVLTGLLGGPFFLLLLWRRRSETI